MGLTSPVFLAFVVVIAVAAPVAVACWWADRHGGETRWSWSRLRRSGGILAACLVAQILAVVATAVFVNDQYGFYSGFADLVGGHSSALQPISVTGISGPGQGHTTTLVVHGRASHTTARVVVWLPPQYYRKAWRGHRFPVVEFLPGQPNSALVDVQRFHLVTDSMALMRRTGKPFVVVVPPIMIRPPSDTECTNVPGGPQALSWLTRDVPGAVSRRFRVQPPGRHWSLLGWSTGGFCAAKMMLDLPADYSAAVGLGAYYQPTTYQAWPHLFGGSARVRRHNSPEWLYRRHGLRGDHLLMVAGRQDPETWPSTQKMLRAARGKGPGGGISFVAFTQGGHNFTDYASARMYSPLKARSFFSSKYADAELTSSTRKRAAMSGQDMISWSSPGAQPSSMR